MSRFAEPWEAQAFALAVSLHERGVFTWPSGREALGAEIAAAPDAAYYQRWLAALERLVARADRRGDARPLPRTPGRTPRRARRTARRSSSRPADF